MTKITNNVAWELPSHYEHKIQKCIINPSDSHQHQLPPNNINT